MHAFIMGFTVYGYNLINHQYAETRPNLVPYSLFPFRLSLPDMA